jgi:uncharacterized membrane protein
MKVNKEYKKYIIYLLISIVIIYALYLSYNIYIQTRTSKRSLNVTLSTIKQKDLEEQTLLYQKQQYAQKVNFLYNTLISQNSISNWVNQENIIAQITGVSAQIAFGSATVSSQSIELGSGTSATPTSAGKTLSVSLNITGTFQGTTEYIRMLENSYYFSNIIMINMTSQKGGVSNLVNTSITLDLYIQ